MALGPHAGTEAEARAEAEATHEPSRRATVAWILYDLANTMFSFVVLSFYFGPWMVDGLGTRDSAVTVSQSAAMAVVLLAAPVLGALTDRTRRMPFLVASTIVAVVMTTLLGLGDLLGLGTSATVTVAIAAFVVANIGYQLGLVFYDALLPVVTTPATIGRIGSWGVGIGYLGSFVGLALGALILGHDADAEPWLFIATGIAFLLFSLPCFFLVKEPRRPEAVPKGIVTRTLREVVQRVKRLPRTPHLGRFMLVRLLYADGVNTLLLVMGIYAVTEAGFSTDTAAYTLLLALGILLAVVSAPLWGMLVDRAGPRHTLNVVLLVWMLLLTVVAIHPVLDLPKNLFFLYGGLLGIGLAGTWTADRPLLVALSPKDEVGAWFGMYALAGRFAAIIGPLMWAFTVDVAFRDHPRARTFGILVLLVQMIIAWVLLRKLADPHQPGRGPLARFTPWGDDQGRKSPRWWRLPLATPAVLFYLIVSWAIFLALSEPRGDFHGIPAAILDGWVYPIPGLADDTIPTLLTLFTAPWLNHDSVQLVYVTLLLLLFGVPFEVKEGTKRFLIVFVGTTFIGAITAGILLHIVYPTISDHAVLEQAWERTWSGGSAGAFGLMGAIAARARTPWPLLAFFAFWELNVGWWYLRSYTPAFHITSLVVGFVWTRYGLAAPPTDKKQHEHDEAPAS